MVCESHVSGYWVVTSVTFGCRFAQQHYECTFFMSIQYSTNPIILQTLKVILLSLNSHMFYKFSTNIIMCELSDFCYFFRTCTQLLMYHVHSRLSILLSLN